MKISDQTQEDRIDSYLRNRLSDDDRALFEVELLEDEDLFDAVREQDLFIRGLIEEKTALDESKSDSEPLGFSKEISFFSWLKFRYSIASALLVCLLALLVPAITFLLPASTTQDPAIELAYVPTVHFAERNRSGENRHVLSGTFPMRVHFDTSNLQGATEFHVSIRSADDGSVLFERQNAQADAEGWVTVDFNTLSTDSISVHFSISGTETALAPYNVSFLQQARRMP